MKRKFKVGDLVYTKRDGDVGITEDRLFRVIELGMDKGNGPPYFTLEWTGRANNGIQAYYEAGWEIYVPPSPTEAGAEEYEEIMQVQDLLT